MKCSLRKLSRKINIEIFCNKVTKDKKIIVLAALFLLLVTYSNRIYDERRYYEVYINDRFITYTNNKKEIKKEYKEVLSYLKNKYEEADIDKTSVVFKSSWNKDVEFSNNIEVKENILKSLQGSVKAKKLILGDRTLGYVSSDKEKKQVFEELASAYIKENGICRDEVKKVDVSGNIKLEDETINISKIEPIEIIASNIYNENKKSSNPLIKIDIVVKNIVNEEIPPSTKIVSTKDLYWGESNTVQGKAGTKEVLRDLTYENGVVISEQRISEKVITKATDSIIYKGAKDPISSGVAFLDPPSRGGITSSYGARWGSKHHGIDIAGNTGDPIEAAFDGTVADTGYNSIYGKMIVIDHGKGVETVYGHCSKILVSAGEKIKKGDLIGRIGTTGRSTGPHLHFELRVNGEAINPIKYVK
ncbi:peptidoglycan DD-metalloendopeptidase family protein [Clostridium sp. 'White wine YQ']|uniref:peptidoglycan DD-metalloendopeptidase family protein n=1 Tax=Clostridium sp. 'White wine YQ' TaxID=3027474 RepID=UPI0023650968|nr:peptidoglycan DD-metalloendopeptidase family protein [Clostridium sp. 'White wine YQ']MDD7796266.1 peptidoglycan DD-metalloendopeptidase family protein [Clostridium sp. 'White wine YQ']